MPPLGRTQNVGSFHNGKVHSIWADLALYSVLYHINIDLSFHPSFTFAKNTRAAGMRQRRIKRRQRLRASIFASAG